MGKKINWKIIAIDGYPRNSGNGFSEPVIVYSIDGSSAVTRYRYEEDDDGKNCSSWLDLPESRQHRPKIWAYLPEPPKEVFEKAVECMKKEREARPTLAEDTARYKKNYENYLERKKVCVG